MKRTVLIFALIAIVLVFFSVQSGAKTKRHSASNSPPDNGCNLRFGGTARKPVKLRATNLNYDFHNNGRAISVAEFLQLACSLDDAVTSPVPADRPMDIEKLKIKLRGFVRAMKVDPDKDLHVQISDTDGSYLQPQIIIEIPPGEAYCDARSAMMELYRTKAKITNNMFKDSPFVEVTGYLFLDATHGPSCTANGGRGLKSRGKNPRSPVKGTWEIHPVISLKEVTP
jgi:hypothetical protein